MLEALGVAAQTKPADRNGDAANHRHSNLRPEFLYCLSTFCLAVGRHQRSDGADRFIRAEPDLGWRNICKPIGLAADPHFSICRARAGKNGRGGYLVALATVGSSESTRTRIGVCTGSSTFEPLVMKASQILFAAPKYPNPIAVPTDACAAPAPSKPKPFRPSPDRDHAVFCTVESATALDGPISETGARMRSKVEVLALISPS
jgi:hypothetical protein